MQNEFQLISHDSFTDLNQELINEKETNFNILNILEAEKECNLKEL